MRIVIHIGLPKTGTTSLQNALKTASHDGMTYARFFCPKEVIQSRCFSNVIGIGRDVLNDVDPKKYNLRSIDSYVERVRLQHEAGTKLLVISDERLCQVDLIDRERLQTMITKMSAFADIQIVFSTRGFLGWLESLLNQALKNDNLKVQEFDLKTATNIMRYPIRWPTILRVWQSLGLPFSILDPHQDLIKQFSALIDLDLPSPTGRLNESLSAQDLVDVHIRSHELARNNAPPVKSILSVNDIKTVRRAHDGWLKSPFAQVFDDTEKALAKSGEVGALSLLKELYAAPAEK